MNKNYCFHFDLSHVDASHTASLHIGRNTYNLTAHTQATRQAAASAVTTAPPHVQKITQATHYAENVEVHSRHLTSYYVTSGPPGTAAEDRALAGFGIHFPALAIPDELKKPTARPVAFVMTAAPAATQASGKLTDRDGHEISGWHSAALSIIFTHPEITNLKPEIAAIVREIIVNSIFFEDAVTAVQSEGTNFATKVLITDPDGTPIYQKNKDGSQGPQRFYYQYSQAVKDKIRAPMLKILREIKDDTRLQGWNWRVQDGVLARQAEQLTPIATKGAKNLVKPRMMWASAAAPAMKVQFSHLGPQAGVDFKLTTNSSTDRSFEFSLTNDFLRYVSVYVQFLKSTQDKNGLPTYDVVDADAGRSFDLMPDEQKIYKEAMDELDKIGIALETKKSKFIRLVDSVPTVLAIPTANVTENFTLRIPDNADTVRIMAGGGFGFLYPSDLKMLIAQEDATVASSVGLIFTGIVNLAVPMIMLAMSVGDDGLADKMLKKLFKENAKVIKNTLKAIGKIAWDVRKIVEGQSAVQMLGDVANLLIGLVMSTTEILTVVIANEAVEETYEQIPLIGQALQAITIAATIAEIAETTGELLASPLVVENNVSFTFDCAVTVQHDPLDSSGFPATARFYELICKYDKGTTHVLSNLPVNQGKLDTAPLTQTFPDLPGAGTFKITANFYAANPDGSPNTFNPVGVGESPVMDATKLEAQEITITIKELVPPLDETTRYSQMRMLDFKDGHTWNANALAPSETIVSLSDKQDAKALSSLVNINFSQTTGAIGYAWRASGQNVKLHGSTFDPTDDNFYTFQNIGSQTSPEPVVFSGEGFSQPVLVCYEMLPPERPDAEKIRQNPNPNDPKWKQLGLMRPPYNFFLQPDAAKQKTFVRLISLDDGKIDLNQTTCYGYFPLSEGASVDSIAIHPSGYLVAISRLQSKLYILPLPHDPLPDDQAMSAVLASGKGSRVNLLQDPISVGCTEKGAILVLDAGANRIQAFDYKGNPLLDYFGKDDQKSNFATLNRVDDSDKYLDLAVEHRGYLYVLAYSNQGAKPSDYRLDIYKPDGSFLVSATKNQPLPASKLTVDYFRNVYCLTFKAFAGPGGRIEPAVSHLIPSIPSK